MRPLDPQRNVVRPAEEMIVGRLDRGEPPAPFRLDRERDAARLRRGLGRVDAENGAPGGACHRHGRPLPT